MAEDSKGTKKKRRQKEASPAAASTSKGSAAGAGTKAVKADDAQEGTSMTTAEAEKVEVGAGEAEQQVADGPSIPGELRRLGGLLAGAVRAAAATPEAEDLKHEVKDGAAAFKREVDDAVDATRERGSHVRHEYADAGSQRMRQEIAGALRVLNRGLENMATRVEPVGADDDAGAGGANDGGGK